MSKWVGDLDIIRSRQLHDMLGVFESKVCINNEWRICDNKKMGGRYHFLKAVK